MVLRRNAVGVRLAHVTLAVALSRRRFPIVKLSREEYLKTVRGFTFKQGIPNLSSNAYDFRWVASQRAGYS